LLSLAAVQFPIAIIFFATFVVKSS